MPESSQPCPWADSDPLYRRYHDNEWGVPVHDDRQLFELLSLEGMQAGLSWLTILRKRENFRAAFDGFDPVQIAGYDGTKVEQLLDNAGIVRNRRKIEAVIANAQSFLKVQAEFGCFDRYLWAWVDGKPKINRWQSVSEIPARTELSDRLSKDLVSRGFKFVGSTICYALLQSAGLVWDHLAGCPCQPGE